MIARPGADAPSHSIDLERTQSFDRLAFTPDGTRLVAAGSREVRVYTLGAGATSYPGHGHLTYGLVISPDGKRIATCGKDQVVRLWRLPR